MIIAIEWSVLMIEYIENTVVSFVQLASEYLHGFEPHIASKTIRQRFIAHFGVSPSHCAWLWLLIEVTSQLHFLRREFADVNFTDMN